MWQHTTPVGVDVLMTHGEYLRLQCGSTYIYSGYDALDMIRSASNVWFCAASFCNFCCSAVRDIVVITRSLLRCQMLFVVFVVHVMFQVIPDRNRTGVNVNEMSIWKANIG